MKKLNEIVDYEFSKERTEKSKYFTEKFFEKYPVKYRELLEKYELFVFLDDTVCKVDKKHDENKNYQNLVQAREVRTEDKK